MVGVNFFLLDINKTRGTITQAYTHTQRHINNVLEGDGSMLSLLCLLLLLLLFFDLNRQCGITLILVWTSIVALFFLKPLSLHFY